MFKKNYKSKKELRQKMFALSKNIKITSLIMITIGIVSLIYGFITDSDAAWSTLLFNNYYFMGIALFAVFFVALQYVSEAGWATVLKRIPESIMSFLPIGGAIMLFIMIAAAMHWNHIYHWMAEGIMDPTNVHYDSIIAGKKAYLNIPFFLIRSFIYVAVWVYCARKLRELSIQGDAEGGLGLNAYNKGVTVSAWFIVFFAITSSTAAWDWIMSIDTHWFSTIFGWYIFAEWATIGFTAILLFTLYVKGQGYLEHVNESHIHDLGKFIFAFSLVWSYMWFSQFMLIWYANIPEEVTYYMQRIDSDNYRFLFWFSLVINLVLPLVILMSRDAKRNNRVLIFVSCCILVGHWINSYLLIAPGTLFDDGHIGWTEIGIGIGFLGLFIYIILKNLTKRPLALKSHPFLDESVHLHT